MDILELSLTETDTLNEIAITEAIETVLNVDDLIEDEESANVQYDFYRNVNLINRY